MGGGNCVLQITTDIRQRADELRSTALSFTRSLSARSCWQSPEISKTTSKEAPAKVGSGRHSSHCSLEPMRSNLCSYLQLLQPEMLGPTLFLQEPCAGGKPGGTVETEKMGEDVLLMSPGETCNSFSVDRRFINDLFSFCDTIGIQGHPSLL